MLVYPLYPDPLVVVGHDSLTLGHNLDPVLPPRVTLVLGQSVEVIDRIDPANFGEQVEV